MRKLLLIIMLLFLSPILALASDSYLSCGSQEMNQLFLALKDGDDLSSTTYPSAACASLQLAKASNLNDLVREEIDEFCERAPFHQVCELPHLFDRLDKLKDLIGAKDKYGDPLLEIKEDFDTDDLRKGLYNIPAFSENPEYGFQLVTNYIITEEKIKSRLKSLRSIDQVDPRGERETDELFHLGHLEMLHYGSSLLLERVNTLLNSYRLAGKMDHPVFQNTAYLMKKILFGEKEIANQTLNAVKAAGLLNRETLLDFPSLMYLDRLLDAKTSLMQLESEPDSRSAQWSFIEKAKRLVLLTKTREELGTAELNHKMNTIYFYKMYRHTESIIAVHGIVYNLHLAKNKGVLSDNPVFTNIEKNKNVEAFQHIIISELKDSYRFLQAYLNNYDPAEFLGTVNHEKAPAKEKTDELQDPFQMAAKVITENIKRIIERF